MSRKSTGVPRADELGLEILTRGLDVRTGDRPSVDRDWSGDGTTVSSCRDDKGTVVGRYSSVGPVSGPTSTSAPSLRPVETSHPGTLVTPRLRETQTRVDTTPTPRKVRVDKSLRGFSRGLSPGSSPRFGTQAFRSPFQGRGAPRGVRHTTLPLTPFDHPDPTSTYTNNLLNPTPQKSFVLVDDPNPWGLDPTHES